MTIRNAGTHRKDEHLALAEKFHNQSQRNDFDNIRFIHHSLPELAVAEVSLIAKLPDFNLSVPFYINAMTGGSERSKQINQQLAEVAAITNLMMATGSQSIALKEPALADTFTIIRQTNPNGLILANLGAGHDLADAKQAITMLQANGLQIHLNAPQEIVMPEGDRQFTWLAEIQNIVANLQVPVIIKEVGFGMSHETIEQLVNVGVSYIDVSGRGGTNFVAIENERRPARELSYLDGWGQSTVESLIEAHQVKKDFTVLASGGIRNALDIVKALRLGASAVGISGTILHYLTKHGPTETASLLLNWQAEIQKIMALLGVRDLTELRKTKIIYEPELINYTSQRGLTLP